MACWQLTCFIIPQAFCARNSRFYSSLFDDDGYICGQAAWAEYQDMDIMLTTIDKHFNRAEQTKPADHHWGTLNENDIQLYTENGKIVDVIIRFALNPNLAAVIDKVQQIAQQTQCCLVLPATSQCYQPLDNRFNQAVIELLNARPKKQHVDRG